MAKVDKFSHWQTGDRYALEKILGKGSYGQVAEATDRKTGNKVAIKFMEDVFSNPIDAKRAYREIHILGKLVHPNIIHLVDVISPSLCARHVFAMDDTASDQDLMVESTKKRSLRDLGDLYVVMDFVDTDLSKIFKSNQNMLIGHIEFILYQLLLGLKFIHSACVIHRDLKPANILVNCRNCNIKIADFGLSRVVGIEEVDDQAVSLNRQVIPSPRIPLPPRPPEPAIARVGKPNENKMKPSVGSILSEARSTLGLSLQPTQVGAAISVHTDVGPAFDEDLGPASAPPQGSKFSVRRQLTHHVITRWYRAPEVILSESYAASVDMWSVGCIFAELLNMLKENCPDYHHRQPMFPGDSCGELSNSDDSAAGFHDGSREQLSVIFDVLGTPSDEDINALSEENRIDLRRFRKRTPENLSRRYPACDANALDLLTRMLAFNPAKRISVDDAIRHPFLAGQLTEEQFLEARCSQPMSIEIESIGEDPNHLFDNIIREVLQYKTDYTSVDSDGLPQIQKKKI